MTSDLRPETLPIFFRKSQMECCIKSACLLHPNENPATVLVYNQLFN